MSPRKKSPSKPNASPKKAGGVSKPATNPSPTRRMTRQTAARLARATSPIPQPQLVALDFPDKKKPAKRSAAKANAKSPLPSNEPATSASPTPGRPQSVSKSPSPTFRPTTPTEPPKSPSNFKSPSLEPGSRETSPARTTSRKSSSSRDKSKSPSPNKSPAPRRSPTPRWSPTPNNYAGSNASQSPKPSPATSSWSKKSSSGDLADDERESDNVARRINRVRTSPPPRQSQAYMNAVSNLEPFPGASSSAMANRRQKSSSSEEITQPSWMDEDDFGDSIVWSHTSTKVPSTRRKTVRFEDKPYRYSERDADEEDEEVARIMSTLSSSKMRKARQAEDPTYEDDGAEEDDEEEYRPLSSPSSSKKRKSTLKSKRQRDPPYQDVGVGNENENGDEDEEEVPSPPPSKKRKGKQRVDPTYKDAGTDSESDDLDEEEATIARQLSRDLNRHTRFPSPFRHVQRRSPRLPKGAWDNGELCPPRVFPKRKQAYAPTQKQQRIPQQVGGSLFRRLPSEEAEAEVEERVREEAARAAAEAGINNDGGHAIPPHDTIRDARRLLRDLESAPRAVDLGELSALFLVVQEKISHFCSRHFDFQLNFAQRAAWPMHHLATKYKNLMEAAQFVASAGPEGWRPVFTQHGYRRHLVHAVLGEWLTQGIFKATLFGVRREDVRRELEDIDVRYLKYDAFVRNKKRALHIETLRLAGDYFPIPGDSDAGRRSDPDFPTTDDYERDMDFAAREMATTLLETVLEPLLPPPIFDPLVSRRSQTHAVREAADKLRNDIYFDLVGLIRKVICLHHCIRFSGREGLVVRVAPHVPKGTVLSPEDANRNIVVNGADLSASKPADGAGAKLQVKMTCFGRVDAVMPHGLDLEAMEIEQQAAEAAGTPLTREDAERDLFPVLPYELQDTDAGRAAASNTAAPLGTEWTANILRAGFAAQVAGRSIPRGSVNKNETDVPAKSPFVTIYPHVAASNIFCEWIPSAPSTPRSPSFHRAQSLKAAVRRACTANLFTCMAENVWSTLTSPSFLQWTLLAGMPLAYYHLPRPDGLEEISFDSVREYFNSDVFRFFDKDSTGAAVSNTALAAADADVTTVDATTKKSTLAEAVASSVASSFVSLASLLTARPLSEFTKWSGGTHGTGLFPGQIGFFETSVWSPPPPPPPRTTSEPQTEQATEQQTQQQQQQQTYTSASVGEEIPGGAPSTEATATGTGVKTSMKKKKVVSSKVL